MYYFSLPTSLRLSTAPSISQHANDLRGAVAALRPSNLVPGSPVRLFSITCISLQTSFVQAYHKVPHCLEGTLNLDRWH